MHDQIGPEELPPVPCHPGLTPEFRMLVACSWTPPAFLEHTQSEKIISLCQQGIDWNDFIALVDRHRVAALVYATLHRHTAAMFPHDITVKLKERSIQVRRMALCHTIELFRVMKYFSARNIDVVPFKGPLLSWCLFGDLGIRHVRDIDLLVKPEALWQADRMLADEGYLRIFPSFELTAKQKTAILKSGRNNHFEYLNRERTVLLELHWRFALWSSEQVEELWKHYIACDSPSPGSKLLVDDMLLLTLCDHGAFHRMARLKWLSDIVMLLAQQRINEWDRLLCLAERLDLKRSLAQAALLTYWLYDFPLPEPLRLLILEQKKAAKSLGYQAMEALLKREEPCGNMLLKGLRDEWYYSWLRPGRSLLSHMRRLMVAPQDWEMISLPDGFYWLYYILRPLLWLMRRIRGAN